MPEWEKHFKIKIPESPTPPQCNKLLATLTNLYHEASFYHSFSEVYLEAMQSGHDKEFAAQFDSLYQNKSAATGKRIAAKTLETLADNKIMDIKQGLNTARIAKNFFKRILDHLDTVRKNLETVSRNNYMQMQLDLKNPTNIPQHAPNNGTFGKSYGDENE
jgi:hypothetical protein